MIIEFVNHASFILEHNGLRIITDPWLFGSAFNDGWDLLCPSHYDIENFYTIDYIWFSHEHPDHFSPPVLMAIPEAIRKSITVLFQWTKDKKVITYCSKLGFKVQELEDHIRYDLGSGIEVMGSNVLFFDSWLCFFVDGKKILNVNDCVVDGELKAEKIKKYTGEVDVLFTQFSYAAWKGGQNDRLFRKESAAKKLQTVKKQIEIFHPTYTVPFASFIYFSHEENKYMNDAINTVATVSDVIQSSGSMPIILFPGEQWNIGEFRDNHNSVQDYRQQYDAIPNKHYHKPGNSVSEEELFRRCNDYLKKIYAKNSKLLIAIIRHVPVLNFFRPLDVLLYDHSQIYRFDIQKGLQKKSGSGYDVKMHSENLSYVFRFDWGYDTLTVNGRFEATLAGFAKMSKNFALGPLNNTGRYVNLSLFFDYQIIRTFLSAMSDFLRRMKRARTIEKYAGPQS